MSSDPACFKSYQSRCIKSIRFQVSQSDHGARHTDGRHLAFRVRPVADSGERQRRAPAGGEPHAVPPVRLPREGGAGPARPAHIPEHLREPAAQQLYARAASLVCVLLHHVVDARQHHVLRKAERLPGEAAGSRAQHHDEHRHNRDGDGAALHADQHANRGDIPQGDAAAPQF